MKRYVTMEEISDGKLYNANDMVKADCLGCQGCSSCCHKMEDTILLDPYDIWQFQGGIGKDAQTLLAEGKIALRVVDGVIVPHLKMQSVSSIRQGIVDPDGERRGSMDQDGPQQSSMDQDGPQQSNMDQDGERQDDETERCPFLDDQGWCMVHACRPGLCRLFPLGRYYEGEGFQYFLQKNECTHAKAKVKISKWLDLPELPKYEAYILEWHGILKKAEALQQENEDEAFAKNLNMFLLKTFFLAPYDGERDFYGQFERRLQAWRDIVEA